MNTFFSLAITVALSWTTFAGGSDRSGSTQTPVWPPFSVKWSVNLGQPGTRVATPVTFDRFRVVKYITRGEEYTLHIQTFDRDGKMLWHFNDKLDPKYQFMINSRDFEGSPSIANRCVYFTGTKKLYCLSLEEGKKLWDFDFNLDPKEDISTVCPLVYGDGSRMLVCTLIPGKVCINDGVGGTLLKTFDNVSAQDIPPAKLSDESILCPAHATNAGDPLAQLPQEALREKGGFATSNNLIVGYYLNAKWMAWRFVSIYNRWEKAWEYDDNSEQPSPFQSFRHATITGDRIILTLPKKLVCVDLEGKELWSYESPVCQWNQMVPVAGNVALLTMFSHGRTLQMLDIRDGLPYDTQEMPVFLQTPPVPTDDGFIAISTGASLWAFSSAKPPKPAIVHPLKIIVSQNWSDFEYDVQVRNIGGSRMTFSLSSSELQVDKAMKRCDPSRSVGFKAKPLKLKPEQKTTLSLDGDGGQTTAFTYIYAVEGEPDRCDINLDGKVDAIDFAAVVAMVGKQPVGKIWNTPRRCDLNDDGRVDILDMIKVLTGLKR